MITVVFVIHCDECEAHAVDSDMIENPETEVFPLMPSGWQHYHGRHFCPTCWPKMAATIPHPERNPLLDNFVGKAVERIKHPLPIPIRARTLVPKTEREPESLTTAVDPEGHTHHTFKP